MKFTVIARNLTPIHSSDPVKSTITLDGTIGAPRGFPLVRMRTILLPYADGEGVLRTGRVPCVPQNTMRNLLRRAMLEQVMDALKGRGQIDVGAYAGAYAGNATGTPEGVPSSFDETIKVRGHVFFGLFGGGPRMIKGRLSVDSLYPIHNHASRVLDAGLEDRLVAGKITDTVWIRRVDPVSKVEESVAAEVIKGGGQAITDWSISSLTNARKAKEKDAEGGEEEASARGLNAFNAHEVVIPGIDWCWRVTADQPSPAQVGLILKGIKNIADLGMQVAGGHARDYGQVAIEDVLIDGESVWAGDIYDQSTEPYFDALAVALDDISAQDFEDFVGTDKKGK
ncbi:TPA: type IV CRISPR-associated protein Csf2 [Pseudomonas aeruginosa]|nr:type IV CRISPR-associated protein Csf2 [Pseudomonas aeruginosa]